MKVPYKNSLGASEPIPTCCPHPVIPSEPEPNRSTARLMEDCRKLGSCPIHRSIPATRTITGLDLDLTEACNLACTYCFKWQKKAVHMDEATAMAAIDWLLESSGDYNGELKVNLMGGEPLLRFDLIQKIVPYGKCRARQLGKRLHFGCTTNCTLLTDQMLSFWRRFGMGFHCSIDGIPEVQNVNRPMLGGGPSSSEVEKNVRKILAYRPSVMARATITPQSVGVLYESAKYFADLGFKLMGFKPAMNCHWTDNDFEVLNKQWQTLGEFYIDRLIEGEPLEIDDFTAGLSSIHSAAGREGHTCGAGRGLVMIDPRGDIWPCHRFGPHQCAGQFRLGKLGEPFNDRLRSAFLRLNVHIDGKPGCHRCKAAAVCAGWCYPECIDATKSVYDPGPLYCRSKRILSDEIFHIDHYLKSFYPRILQQLTSKSD